MTQISIQVVQQEESFVASANQPDGLNLFGFGLTEDDAFCDFTAKFIKHLLDAAPTEHSQELST